MIRFVIILGVLLAGCGSAGTVASETPAAPPSAEATVEASAAETAAASESPPTSGDGELCAEGFETCVLDPGTYTAAPFEPNFSFTIEEQWTNDRAYADGGGISQDAGGIYWGSGVTEGNVANETVEIGTTAEDFVTFLQAFAAIGMTVSEPTEVTIDGVTGQQVDIETNDVEQRSLYLIADDAFNLVPQEKARFIVLEPDGEAVVLIIDAFAAADFDEWVETAQPVVDSIRWE